MANDNSGMLRDKVPTTSQESILALLLYDDVHGGAIASMVTPELFDGEYEEIARRVGRYWAKYNCAPKRQTDELFADIFGDTAEGRSVTYAQLFVHLLELHQSGINVTFLQDTVNRFTRTQRLRHLVVKLAESMRTRGEDALEDADRDMDVYRQQRVDGGSKRRTLFEPEAVLANLSKNSREFTTGIEPLDRGNVVPTRGEMMVLLGTPGTGKSWGLIHFAKQAMLARKKVLYASCEMSADVVAARFYQAILSIPKRRMESVVTGFSYDDGKFAGFTREQVQADFALMDDYALDELTVRMRRFGWIFRNLSIRSYAAGELTPGLLNAAIDNDVAMHDFVPDMVIVDYLGIMDVDKKDMRVSMGRNAINLRGIASSKNIAMVAAQQISREGKKAMDAGQDVDVQHTAEDWSLIGTVDVAITLSKTKLEAELGLMRLLTAKVRGEKAHYSILCTQDYSRGQFALEATRIPSGYGDKLKTFGKVQSSGKEADDDADDPE